MLEMEYRIAAGSAEAEELNISGYAAMFDSPSLPLMHRGQRVIETIDPHAFDRSLQSGENVSMYWAHGAGMPIANTRSGTLTLSTDDRGLKFQASLANTSLARDAVALVRSGVVSHMSFGFTTRTDTLQGDARRLMDVDLGEISLVEHPAYLATVAEAREFSLCPLTRTQLRLRALIRRNHASR